MALRVLVVDDSRIMIKKMTAMLSELGYQVAGTAENGQLAMEEYARLRPDLVTMDISMPEMDGIESSKLILSRFPDARIIMVTAMGQQQLVLQAMNLGVAGYVLKPVEGRKLSAAINNALKRKTSLTW